MTETQYANQWAQEEFEKGKADGAAEERAKWLKAARRVLHHSDDSHLGRVELGRAMAALAGLVRAADLGECELHSKVPL